MKKKSNNCCCENFYRAGCSGTDNEGYGAVVWSNGQRIGTGLPLISFCPWCGHCFLEEDDLSVLALRHKHGISSENRSGSKEEAEILSGKRISEKEK